MEIRKIRRRIWVSVVALFSILLTGVVGYMLIEGYSFKDALYMTIITVTTVGFGLVKPLTPAGTYFTVLLIVTSFVLIAFVIQSIISVLIDTDFRLFIKRLRMERLVSRLRDHVIVCGYGKNGHHAVEELLLHGEIVVVVEKDHSVIAEHEFHKKENLYFIEGDATQDEILQAANVQKAKALISALPLDADNVFVVLTARGLNPKLLIISRANDEQSDSKLRRAGADYVIMPDHIGGHRMGKLVSQPDVLEFLDYIMVKSGNTVNIESIPCEKLPREYMGKTIGELDIRRNTGANVIGLRLGDGTYIFNPSPNERIEAGSRLFVLGTPEQIEKLIKLYKN